jgi:hypothetical protein
MEELFSLLKVACMLARIRLKLRPEGAHAVFRTAPFRLEVCSSDSLGGNQIIFSIIVHRGMTVPSEKRLRSFLTKSTTILS